MRRSSSQSQLKQVPFRGDDHGNRQELVSIPKQLIWTQKRGDESEYEHWRQDQTAGIAKLKKYLKTIDAMKALIEDRSRGYQEYFYNRWFQPNWAPPNEQAAVFWFGEWRPSAILSLVASLSRSFDGDTEQALSQVIQNVRIEEAVIDEEMIEIQANCIFHLPFGSVKTLKRGPGRVKSELRKVSAVTAKAQKLRGSTVEMVLKKVLNHIDGARFLVAFGEIQEVFHDFCIKFQAQKGKVFITNPAD